MARKKNLKEDPPAALSEDETTDGEEEEENVTEVKKPQSDAANSDDHSPSASVPAQTPPKPTSTSKRAAEEEEADSKRMRPSQSKSKEVNVSQPLRRETVLALWALDKQQDGGVRADPDEVLRNYPCMVRSSRRQAIPVSVVASIVASIGHSKANEFEGKMKKLELEEEEFSTKKLDSLMKLQLEEDELSKKKLDLITQHVKIIKDAMQKKD